MPVLGTRRAGAVPLDMDFDVAHAFERVQGALLPALDIVAGRVDDAHVPAWCATRGWSDFLLGLAQQALERCEAEGLPPLADTLAGVPRDLLELAAQVNEASRLPTLAAAAGDAPAGDAYRGVNVRK